MTRLRRFLLAAVVPALLVTSLGAAASRRPALALVNESPSLPRGLYLRTPGTSPDRGAVVALRQPSTVRPYLAALGMPGEVRLIKRVAATEGDAVCSDGRWLLAPGRIIRIARHDRSGRPLPAWRGCRRLAEHERLVLGDTPSSFDGRYFGPITVAQIEGVYREAVTW